MAPLKGEAETRRLNQGQVFQHLTSLSSYSPKGELFLHVSLAVDKHRLRVYDTTSQKSIAEYVSESGRITAVTWMEMDSESGAGAPKAKRKRKKRNQSKESAPPIQVIALGLSTGMLVLFSPIRNQVVHSSPKPLSSAAVLSITSAERSVLWASSADGCIRAWSTKTAQVLGTWQEPDHVPYSSIALRNTDDGAAEILAGHHNIRLLSVQPPLAEDATDIRQPIPLASFTGHASPITALECDPSTNGRFASAAEDDRMIQLWEVPPNGGEGRICATIPLDSEPRSVRFAPKAPTAPVLLSLSASGTVYVHSLPDISSTSPSKIPSLTPKSTICASTEAGQTGEVVAAQLIETLPGYINVAQVISMRPVFQSVRYLDDSGDFLSSVEMQPVNLTKGILDDDEDTPNLARYSDQTAAISSGAQLPRDPDFDDIEPSAGADGELDAELAELTLGQKLQAMTPQLNGAGPSEAKPITSVVTMTRTLTQALHSNDAQLMDTCLITSDERTIRGTVQNLRQDLIIPLVNTLVERLGKGGSGKVGGASSEHALTIVTWLRVVLFTHTSYLLTNPDLVARLATLHSTLAARSALKERLQMLSGRLDLVFSQVKMRGPADGAYGSGQINGTKSEATVYVEGESSEEDEDGRMDVEVEEGEDDGSVQDIELGSDDSELGGKFVGEDSEEDSDEDEDDEEDEDDDDSDNLLIDDEAEESDDDDDEDNSAEEDEYMS